MSIKTRILFASFSYAVENHRWITLWASGEGGGARPGGIYPYVPFMYPTSTPAWADCAAAFGDLRWHLHQGNLVFGTVHYCNSPTKQTAMILRRI